MRVNTWTFTVLSSTTRIVDAEAAAREGEEAPPRTGTLASCFPLHALCKLDDGGEIEFGSQACDSAAEIHRDRTVAGKRGNDIVNVSDIPDRCGFFQLPSGLAQRSVRRQEESGVVRVLLSRTHKLNAGVTLEFLKQLLLSLI